jgi:hypothetical protein
MHQQLPERYTPGSHRCQCIQFHPSRLSDGIQDHSSFRWDWLGGHLVRCQFERGFDLPRKANTFKSARNLVLGYMGIHWMAQEAQTGGLYDQVDL